MRLRFPLLLLAGALAGSIVPSTAFAAVPKGAPNTTYACNQGTAALWVDAKHVAADNPCDRWFIIVRTAADGTEYLASLAPRGHFTRKAAELGWPKGGTRGYFAKGWECGAVFKKNSHGKATWPCNTPWQP